MITKAKIAIDESGLKQIFIAKKLKMDNTELSRYVSGNRKMPYKIAKELSVFLKVPLENVINTKDYSEEEQSK